MSQFSVRGMVDARLVAATNPDESRTVGQIRLLLAGSVLLAMQGASQGLATPSVLCAVLYLLYSGLLLCFYRHAPDWTERAHWLDVLWLGLLVSGSGNQGILYMAFFFPILAASFSHGREEGICITLAAAASLGLCHMAIGGAADAERMLLRIGFILAVGGLSAHWGEAKLREARRLALLRELAQPGNPRFGWQATLTTCMRRLMEFYRADACVLITLDPHSQRGHLHRVGSQRDERAQHLDLDSQIANTLLQGGPGWLQSLARAPQRPCAAQMRLLACGEILGSRHFISVPLLCRGESARLFVLLPRPWPAPDARFLQQAAELVMSVVDGINLLDTLATDASQGERRRLGWTVHDDVIQPCIGLQMGLTALRKKAAAGGSLVLEIDRLLAATEDAVRALRDYSGRAIESKSVIEAPILAALRRRIEQAQSLYGLTVEFSFHGQPARLPDRLAAELLHMSSEAISNISRHSGSSRARLFLQCGEGMASLVIEDEGQYPPGGFRPRSIAARAASLGGCAWAQAAAGGGTRVSIEIPL
jgi:signal transduction histidine kinase